MKNNQSTIAGISQRNRRQEKLWVCALGKHQNIWDFAVAGTFEDCLDYAWGNLQHETDLNKNHRLSKNFSVRNNKIIHKIPNIPKEIHRK